MKLPGDWISSNPYLERLAPDFIGVIAGRALFSNGWSAKIQVTQGYQTFRLYLGRINGKKRSIGIKISRLTCWKCHGPAPHPESQVDHINRIKSDDRPENLRWVTQAVNSLNNEPKWRAEQTKHLEKYNASHKGSSRCFAKLTEQIVFLMRSQNVAGVSIAQLARKYGVSTGTAGKAISRKKWKHVQ